MKLEVIVVDAGNEQSFKSSLSQINVNNTDLIIGPFFKSSVLDALDYVGDKKIPLVSPFANSEDLYGYSNLIITEANEDIYVDKMNDEIGKIYSNQKIYLLSGNTPEMAQKLKAKLEQKINKSLISIVKSANDIQADKNMMTGKAAPIIAVLADDNEALANDFANRLIQLSKEVNGVKGFSMTFSTIFEKKYNDLSQVNFVYLMDRKINTDGEFEKEILKDYKNKYCTTPSKYSIIGFDVVYDMLSRENKNGEIYNQMGKTQTQLATKFEFVKTKSNGAYINQGVRIIRFTP
jgi:ABC-type branched-subunit amino acid transport system substrate-binding protein